MLIVSLPIKLSTPPMKSHTKYCVNLRVKVHLHMHIL